jgi:hypothetical protein
MALPRVRFIIIINRTRGKAFFFDLLLSVFCRPGMVDFLIIFFLTNRGWALQYVLGNPAYPAQNLIRSYHIQAGYSPGQQIVMQGSVAPGQTLGLCLM